MARLPRLVIPGIPHHVTQRGNRRERTVFEDDDYALYLDLLADAARLAHAEIWSYWPASGLMGTEMSCASNLKQVMQHACVSAASSPRSR
jgi:hypothetical protein